MNIKAKYKYLIFLDSLWMAVPHVTRLARNPRVDMDDVISLTHMLLSHNTNADDVSAMRE